MININALMAFQSIVQEGSASAAAAKLGMSNPSVSRHIHALEHQLKLKLFHRTRRRLILTEEGARFFAETERILRNLSSLPAIARDIRNATSQSLRVIAMPRQASSIVSPAVAEISATYPDLKLSLDVFRRSKLDEWIEGRSFDVGFGTFPITQDHVDIYPLIRSQVMVAMANDDPLADKDVITAADLSERGQIAFPRGTIPRRQTDEMMQSAGSEPNYVLETSDFTFACRQCIDAGKLFLTDPVSALTFGDALVCRPLWTRRWIQFGAFFPAGSRRNAAIDALVAATERICTSLVERGLAEALGPQVKREI